MVVVVVVVTTKTQNLASAYRTFLLTKLRRKASVQKARNGPSTQLVEATSCIERSNATIKAKELS